MYYDFSYMLNGYPKDSTSGNFFSYLSCEYRIFPLENFSIPFISSSLYLGCWGINGFIMDTYTQELNNISSKWMAGFSAGFLFFKSNFKLTYGFDSRLWMDFKFFHNIRRIF
jgi:hypothetical protein